jgi:DNA-binding NarL/FixJ family response regulator
MPEILGIDLARVLAQQRPGLPVVITTGYVSAGLRAEAQQIGVRQVLQKEYTLEQLPELLRRALSGP